MCKFCFSSCNCKNQLMKVGEHFGVRLKNQSDRSYRDSIFVCNASDENKVVGRRIAGGYGLGNEKPFIFDKEDVDFHPVSKCIVDAAQCNCCCKK